MPRFRRFRPKRRLSPRARRSCWETTPWPGRLPPGSCPLGCRSKSSLPATPGRWCGEQFEQFWSRQPIRHLFLTTPHDPEARLAAGEAAWQRRYERGILTPFFLCQEWLTRLEDARLCDGATLVATTALGSDFGFSGNLEHDRRGRRHGPSQKPVHRGALRKMDRPAVQGLGLSGSEPAGAAAEAVFQELAADRARCRSRLLRRPPPRRAGGRTTGRAATAPDACHAALGSSRAEDAASRRSPRLALARRFGLKLHLLGLSPHPDIDPSWRSLSASGLEQLKHSTFRQAHAAGRLAA